MILDFALVLGLGLGGLDFGLGLDNFSLYGAVYMELGDVKWPPVVCNLL